MFTQIRGHTVYSPALNKDSVILDLGANHGEFAKQMSDLFGGTYYVVEANPDLSNELAFDGRFSVLNYAVTDSEGPISFNLAHNDEGSSILTLPKQNALNCVLRETVIVQAKRLQSIISELGISKIDLLKMDIEGAEVSVLASLEPEILQRIGQITVEFHSAPEFGFDLGLGVENVLRRMRKLDFITMDFSFPQRIDVLFINRTINKTSSGDAIRWQYLRHPPLWVVRFYRSLPASFRRGCVSCGERHRSDVVAPIPDRGRAHPCGRPPTQIRTCGTPHTATISDK